MARRKKKQSLFEDLVIAIFFIMESLLKLIFRLLSFLYDLITFYTSGYKKKSGNGFFKTFFDKGNYGELILYRKVIRVIDKRFVLTNLYLEGKNTETTEIDILAVTDKGIYVFEIKNYGGYIYGSEKDQYWTQVMNKWSKHKFYNPLRQNYAHTKAIEKFLNIDSTKIIPIIVFSNRSILSKVNMSDNHNIYQFIDTIKFIKYTEKKGLSTLDDKDVDLYLLNLLDKTLMSEEVKQKHIEEVKLLQQ